jgi:hypothetical protein
MSIENEAPIAQGDVQAEVQSGVPEGVQKRIDELTAKVHSLDRERVAEQQRFLETLTQIQQSNAQLQAQVLASKTQVQEEELDPANPEHLQKLIAREADKRTEGLKRQVEELTQRFSSSAVSTQMAEVQSKLAKANPVVVKRVQQLVGMWQADGRLAKGIATPQDAYLLAMGEFAAGELAGVTDSQEALRQFNGTGTPVVTRQSAPGPARKGGNTREAFESSFAQLDLSKLSATQLDALQDQADSLYPDGIEF